LGEGGEKSESPKTRLANPVQSEQPMQTNESSSRAEIRLCFRCGKPRHVEKTFFLRLANQQAVTFET